MTWISTIPFELATGRLKKLYERVTGPDDNVDNIMLAHSLRPHTMEGHMTLYKNVLHHTGNSLPKWYLEAIGVYVSLLNECHYCVEHHYEGLIVELGGDRTVDGTVDRSRATKIRTALENNNLPLAFSKNEISGLTYSEKLTRSPSRMTQADIEILGAAGFDDGEILAVGFNPRELGPVLGIPA